MKIANLQVLVEWEKFQPGTSFFIPCIDRKGMERQIRDEAEHLKVDMVCKHVIENGMYGVRIWRSTPRMQGHSGSPPQELTSTAK